MAFVRDNVQDSWSRKPRQSVFNHNVDTNPLTHADRASNDRFLHPKKMTENDYARRGNGNIISPQPLTWEESRPKIRQSERYADDVLLKCVNQNDAYKERQIANMAKCGQENFFKGFSQQPARQAGTQKVAQNALHKDGIGIWGFGGMGRMSDESTNGLRKSVAPRHLAPINASGSNGNGGTGGVGNTSGMGMGGGNKLSPIAEKATRPPWARYTDLVSPNGSPRKGALGSPYLAPLSMNAINSSDVSSPLRNNNNNYSSNQGQQPRHSVYTHQRESKGMNACLHMPDHGSNDARLRQRHNNYPNPSTVPFTNNVDYNPKSYRVHSPTNNIFNGGYSPKREVPAAAQSHLTASPAGARFSMRDETTANSFYKQPM